MNSEWQPIETAPRDGTAILTYEPAGKFGNGVEYPGGVAIACFVTGDPLNGDYWTGLFPRSYPTHWMPLPAQPGKETA